MNAILLCVVTAYCACPLCTHDGDGITASGRRVRPEWTVASNVLPLRTKVNVVGLGVRSVEDRLARRFTYRDGLPTLDIYMPSHRAARRFGKQIMLVEVIR